MLQAILSDARGVVLSNRNPLRVPALERNVSVGIFGQQWLLTAVDELHNARNVGKLFWSISYLRMQSRAFVGMTATPVLTRPQVSTRIPYGDSFTKIICRTSGILAASWGLMALTTQLHITVCAVA